MSIKLVVVLLLRGKLFLFWGFYLGLTELFLFEGLVSSRLFLLIKISGVENLSFLLSRLYAN